MKHKDMVPLMGKVVTVSKVLSRVYRWGGVIKWEVRVCGRPWSGWIVGFTYRQDGKVDDEGGSFQETSRQLCVLVKSWPTRKAIPVPLDGYKLGGKPIAGGHF